MPLHIDTPLLESRPLQQCVTGRVLLKMDALQPAGSFKIRGIGHACEHYARQGFRRFVASSAGNAGLAVSYAGRKLGLPVLIVVPESTSPQARARILLEGAEVIVLGDSWAEAHAHARTLLCETDAYIHPFDDPLLWEGHATLIDEVVAAGARPDMVVLAVGGGGLLCGIMSGLERNNLHETRVLAVETDGAQSFSLALTAGGPVDLARITSIASSLGARRVCQEAYEWTRKRDIQSMVVSDSDAVLATRRLLADHRVLVEAACGAALAPVYANASQLHAAAEILVVVCGGMNVRPGDVRWPD